jgi:hypothetical protein
MSAASPRRCGIPRCTEAGSAPELPPANPLADAVLFTSRPSGESSVVPHMVGPPQGDREESPGSGPIGVRSLRSRAVSTSRHTPSGHHCSVGGPGFAGQVPSWVTPWKRPTLLGGGTAGRLNASPVGLCAITRGSGATRNRPLNLTTDEGSGRLLHPAGRPQALRNGNREGRPLPHCEAAGGPRGAGRGVDAAVTAPIDPRPPTCGTLAQVNT